MADPPTEKNETEVEIVCPHCEYRMTRTAARLRREVDVVCPQCGATIVPGADDESGKG